MTPHLDMTATALSDAVHECGGIGVAPRPSCLLCGKTGTELYTGLVDWLFGVPGSWGLRTCRTCGIIWLDPQPTSEEIPKLYSRYYTHRGAAAPTRSERIRDEVVKCALARLGYRVGRSRYLLPRLLFRARSVARATSLDVLAIPASEIGSLLDVGCGDGQFIGKMRSLGWDVSGVDPDPSAVACGHRQGFRVFQGTIADVPEDARYDVITLNHVIEHVADPIDLLRECRRRLRAGTGRLIITTPNVKSLGHRWFGQHWRGFEIPRHLFLFCPQALSEAVSRAGLRVNMIRSETRLARMIYNTSVYAKAGERELGGRVQFNAMTKIASYLFQAMEDAAICFKKDVGEEILASAVHPSNHDSFPDSTHIVGS